MLFKETPRASAHFSWMQACTSDHSVPQSSVASHASTDNRRQRRALEPCFLPLPLFGSTFAGGATELFSCEAWPAGSLKERPRPHPLLNKTVRKPREQVACLLPAAPMLSPTFRILSYDVRLHVALSSEMREGASKPGKGLIRLAACRHVKDDVPIFYSSSVHAGESLWRARCAPWPAQPLHPGPWNDKRQHVDCSPAPKVVVLLVACVCPRSFADAWLNPRCSEFWASASPPGGTGLLKGGGNWPQISSQFHSHGRVKDGCLGDTCAAATALMQASRAHCFPIRDVDRCGTGSGGPAQSQDRRWADVQ